MSLKTAILCISVLTFKLFTFSAFANFSDEGWIFHAPSGDKKLVRCGKDLGNPQVNLFDLAKEFPLKISGTKDIKITHIPSQRSVRISLRHKNIQALSWPAKKDLDSNWSMELSTLPKKISAKKICVPIDFGDRVIIPLLEGAQPVAWNEHLRYTSSAQVVIDPGHGGDDWGTVGIYKGELLKEKNLTLEFSRELIGALKARGVAVATTRTQDLFVALEERQSLVNSLNPRLFLSMHLNSQGIARGFEIFALSTFRRDRKALISVAKKTDKTSINKALMSFKSTAKQEASLEWASVLSKSLSSFLPPVNQGVRRAPFFLLYAVQTPALLVELGSLDREEDIKLWLNAEQRKAIWQELADSISAQLKLKP